MSLNNTERTVAIIVGIISVTMMVGGAYLGSQAGQDKRFDNIEDQVLMIQATYPDNGSMVKVIKEALVNHSAIPHPSSAPKQMLMDAKKDIAELKQDFDKAADRQEEMRDEQVEQGKDLVEIKTSLKTIERFVKDR